MRHVEILFLLSLGDSTRLITGSADQTAKLWDVQTGTPFFTFNFDSPARSVDFAVGDKLAVITTDPFMELPSAIHIKQIARDPDDREFIMLLLLFIRAHIFGVSKPTIMVNWKAYPYVEMQKLVNPFSFSRDPQEELTEQFGDL